MNTIARSSAKTLFVAGVLATGLAGTAAAQQFAFGQSSFDVTAGNTLNLPIILSGEASPVAGVNFTLRIAGADNGKVQLSDANATVNGSLAAFTYMDNALTRSSYTNGAVAFTGTVQEYRGVLYSANASPDTFNANSPITIATLSIPTVAGQTGAVQIELVSAIDAQTGLLGVSDASGTSQVPAGQTRPLGAVATINLIAPSEFPVATDFKATGGHPEWAYSGDLIGNVNEATVVGAGLSLARAANEAFAFWSTNFKPDGLTGWRKPATGLVYVVDYDIKSQSDTYGDEPTIRTRVSTANDYMIHELLAQEFAPGNGVDVTAGTAGSTYRTLTPVPSYTNDGGFDGFKLAFDLTSFDIGRDNIANRLGSINERVFDPATLTGASVVYNATFTTGATNGWVTSLDVIPGFGDRLGRKVITFPVTTSGLGLASGGPFEPCPDCSDKPYLQNKFSFGWWQTPDNSSGWVANSNKVYKITADVRIDGTTAPKDAPGYRFRVYPASQEFFQVVTVNPFVDRGVDNLPRPTSGASPIEAWVATHPGADGQTLNLAFDMIHVAEPLPGGNQTPTVFLKSITVTEYNKPF